MSKLEKEKDSTENLKVKYIIIPKLLKFNNKKFHDIIMNCKETLEGLEIKDDLESQGTVKFLQDGLKHMKALKRLKVFDLQRVSVIKGAHPSLESIEMQCAYYMEPRMSQEDLIDIFMDKNPGFTLIFRKFKFHILTEEKALKVLEAFPDKMLKIETELK